MRKTILACLGLLLIAAGLTAGPQDVPTVPEAIALKWEIAALRQQIAFAQATVQVCQGQLAPTAYKAAIDAVEPEIRRLRDTFEAEFDGWTLDASGRPVRKEARP